MNESVIVPSLPSSRSVVREQLTEPGVQLGSDTEKKRIVVVETRRLSLKGDRQKETSSLKNRMITEMMLIIRPTEGRATIPAVIDVI